MRLPDVDGLIIVQVARLNSWFIIHWPWRRTRVAAVWVTIAIALLLALAVGVAGVLVSLYPVTGFGLPLLPKSIHWLPRLEAWAGVVVFGLGGVFTLLCVGSILRIVSRLLRMI